MESKANYALVGLISLLVFILAAGFIYWFAVSDNKVATKEYRIIFSGTVTGLSSGTQVLFNGIKAGQVKSLRIDPEDPGRVIARIEVNETAPVKADTKAVLESQGLTGVSYVQLSGGTPDAAPLEPAPGQDVPTIIADKSDLQTILDGVRDTIENASVAFEKLEDFVDENAGKTSRTLSDIEQFSDALAANSENMQTFLASMSEAGGQVGPLAADLRKLSNRLNTLVGDVEPEKVAGIVDNIDAFTRSLSANSGKVDRFFADAVKLSASLNGSAGTIAQLADALDPKAVSKIVGDISKASTAVAANVGNFNTLVANATNASTRINSLVGEVEPGKVGQTVDDISSFSATLAGNNAKLDTVMSDAARLSASLNASAETIAAIAGRVDAITARVDPDTVGKMVDDLSSVTTTIGDNREKVDRFMNDMTEVSSKLAASVDKVQNIVDNIDTMTANADTQGLFQQLSDAADAVKVLAQNLDTRTELITNGVGRFSTQGLAEYAALASDARQVLRRLDKVLTDLDRNPQSIIFGNGGSGGVREYTKQ